MNGDEAAARSRHAPLTHIDEALRALKDPHPSDEAIHSARKAIKAARAALRLLRDSLGERAYQKENVAMRDAGRCLSPLRDAKSMVDVFRAFRARHAEHLRDADAAALARQLEAKLSAQRNELSREPAAMRLCRSILVACRARLKRRPPDGSYASVLAGVRRIYRCGRTALAAARCASTPEAWHEGRKQVKYLSLALNILDVSHSPRGAKLQQRAETAADKLGEDHDLAELARYVNGMAPSGIEAKTREDLSALIASRRAKLQKRVRALSEKMYAKKWACIASGL